MSLRVWVDERDRESLTRYFVVEQYEHDREAHRITAGYTYRGAAQTQADAHALQVATNTGDPVELFRGDAWVRIEVIR